MAGLLEVLDRDQAAARIDNAAAERIANTASAQAAAAAELQANQFLCRLDGYVKTCFEAARNAKESMIEREMLDCIRQREGKYSQDKLLAIKDQGGSEVYMMLTNAKCRAAEAMIRDILLPAGERPFTAKSSPVPSLSRDITETIYANTMTELQQIIQQGIYVTPQQVNDRAREQYDQSMNRLKEEANLRAQRMEDQIDDILKEGAWYEALQDMISDLVDLPAAFMKGPVIRRQRRLTWQTDAQGKSAPMAEDELVPVFYSPSPLDIYPSPDSKDTDDGYLCEKIPLRRASLARMRGVPGYDTKRIEMALNDYQHGGMEIPLAGEQERRELEKSRNWQNSPDQNLDAIEFHGSVRGEWLLEWGMDPAKVPDPNEEYEVTCLYVGRHTVRCVLNEDPLGRRPYMKACYDKIKGQFWGNSLAHLIRDLQDVCNAAARAIVNNMGLASGPLVEVEVDRLANGENITQIYPWRIFQTQASKTQSPSPAVRFNQPSLVTQGLMEVYRYFSGLADQYSGIPSYEQGVNPMTGAAGTASGLSMLLGASSRQIKYVISGIDRVIKGSVERVHTYVMLFVDKPEVKGDVNLDGRGTASLVVKEQQQIRRQEFLAATANAFDAPIMGQMGRAEMLRQSLKAMDLDPDTIVPPKDMMLVQQKMEQMQQAQMQQMQMQQMQDPTGKSRNLDAAGNPAGGGQAATF